MKAPWWVETCRMLIICTSLLPHSLPLRRSWRISRSLSWQKWADTKHLSVSSCSYIIPLLSEMFTSMTMFGRCILDTGGNRLFFNWESIQLFNLLSSRLAPALHFSSRNFSSSQGSLEKSGESTLNQEEVDKFRAMSRSAPLLIHPHLQLISVAPGGILKGSAVLFIPWID